MSSRGAHALEKWHQTQLKVPILLGAARSCQKMGSSVQKWFHVTDLYFYSVLLACVRRGKTLIVSLPTNKCYQHCFRLE